MTPGYRTWDPSVVVLFSFAAFFAMILSDAGYAVMLAAALPLMWPRLGRARSGSRCETSFCRGRRLVGYGVIVGSYFGIVLPRDPSWRLWRCST